MQLFWEKYSKHRNFNINNFRNTKHHNIFSNWSPYDRGLTFHNFLINYFVKNNEKKFINFKKKINNLNLGKPPGIIYDNKYNISYDDCLSFEEYIFLNKHLVNTKPISVVEIGPGYGRTVEAMLKNFKIKIYVVVDYKNILLLTKKYLRKVLKKSEYNKVYFVNFEDFKFKKDFFVNEFNIRKFDLFFNADSFHEIEKFIIKKYLKYFSYICESFFIKNAVGKYRPVDLVDHLTNKKIPKYNKKLGLCFEEINIFDNKKKKIQVKKYLERYEPYKYSKIIKYELSSIYPSTLLSYFKK
jgi:putative sugar O-methyltransferase